MAKARNWAGLSEAQRKRYVSAGRTGTLTGRKGLTPLQVQRYYESGRSLSAGRGHSEEIPTRLRKIALKASTGNVTAQDKKELKVWRKGRNYPTWLPRSNSVMQDDTAAALYLLGTAPKNWQSVVVKDNGDGTFTVLVTTKRGAKRATVLADREAVGELARLIRNPVEKGRTKLEKRDLENAWLNSSGEQWSFSASFPDTDLVSMAPTEINIQNLPTSGSALPKRKRK